MVKYTKKGWIRILEAIIAALLVLTVFIVVSLNQKTERYDIEEQIYNIERKIIKDIALSDDKRALVLGTDSTNVLENEVSLKALFANQVPTNYDFYIRICEFELETDGSIAPCVLHGTQMLETAKKEVFVEETIISTNIDVGTLINPKKVKIFVWLKNT